MTSKLSIDTILAIEAITAIKVYRKCTAEEAAEILMQDTPNTIEEARSSGALGVLLDVYKVAGEKLFEAMREVGLDPSDPDDFQRIYDENYDPDDDYSEEDSEEGSEEGSDDPVYH